MDKKQKDFLANNEFKLNGFTNTLSAIDSENKTIEVILSDESEVVRFNWEDGFYDIILAHEFDSVDLTRSDIMPLLVQHNTEMLPIGRWDNLRIEDNKLKGTAVFDTEDEFAMTIFGKFERNIMKSFSIGIGEWERVLFEEKNSKGRKTYKAVKWSLQECSVVTIPANSNAKVGFKNQQNEENQEKITPKNEKNDFSCYNDEVKKPNKEKVSMNLSQLKSEHPDLYAEVFNAGAKSEKERVLAHVEMSKTSGAIEYALECIEKGEEFSSIVQAKYMGFAMTNQQKQARQEENIEAIQTDMSNTNVDENEQKDEIQAKSLADRLGVDYKVVGE